jgi:hypothetical protein
MGTCGVPAHGLPRAIFGLFDELRVGDDIPAASLPSRQFARLAKSALHDAGIPTDRVGTRSFRKGRAVSLFFDQIDRATVSLVLRHRAPQPADAHILDAARVTAVASALRAALRGRHDEARPAPLPGPGTGPAVAQRPRGGQPPAGRGTAVPDVVGHGSDHGVLRGRVVHRPLPNGA